MSQAHLTKEASGPGSPQDTQPFLLRSSIRGPAQSHRWVRALTQSVSDGEPSRIPGHPGRMLGGIETLLPTRSAGTLATAGLCPILWAGPSKGLCWAEGPQILDASLCPLFLRSWAR